LFGGRSLQFDACGFRLSRFHTKNGAFWCKMVYSAPMKNQRDFVRQSISLPQEINRRVRGLAQRRKSSANRVLVDLIEAGLRSKDAEKELFFALTNRLAESTDSAERRRIKKQLARMTFGN
jgi:hypothetical protein